jgi:hypothetical protein
MPVADPLEQGRTSGPDCFVGGGRCGDQSLKTGGYNRLARQTVKRKTLTHVR